MTLIIPNNQKIGEAFQVSVIYLEAAPVMFKSATQKHVAMSVTEAELYAGVSTAQDMLYVT